MRRGRETSGGSSQPSLDLFDDEPLDDAENPTYSVVELAAAINDQLRRGFLDGVWVRGEISGLRSSGPHQYFTIIEDGPDGKAVLNVSLFAPMRNKLTPVLRRNNLELSNGMKVRIYGHLDYYAPNGRLGLKMAGIDPRFTLGELSQARDQVVRRLVATGLFDRNRSRSVPAVPLRVGVVTSVGTAAWHDFLQEIESSGFGFGLVVADTRVQGDGAAESVAGAISALGRIDVDVIVVIRGGGARNELAVFDAEQIATSIASSPRAVLTGLGHEIDQSVADLVAHTALKTPTAVAAFLVDLVAEYRSSVELAWQAITRRAGERLGAADELVGDMARVAQRSTIAAVGRSDERLATRVSRFASISRHRVGAAHQRIEARRADLYRASERTMVSQSRLMSESSSRLVVRAQRCVQAAEGRLDSIDAQVRLADPDVLLRRGWSITRSADGSVIRSVTEAQPGTVLTTTVADGTVTSRVEPVSPTAESAS